MPRPRRPFGGVETISHRTEYMGVALGVRERLRWDASTHWGYRTPNGQYDPLTFLFVLDAVAGIDPDIELRSGNLAAFLRDESPSLSWDPVTVGKVLSDICEAFEDVLSAKNGILERGKDYRGSFFRVHHNPATAELYQQVRKDLMRLAEFEISARAAGIRPPRLVSPLLECGSLRGVFDLSGESVV